MGLQLCQYLGHFLGITRIHKFLKWISEPYEPSHQSKIWEAFSQSMDGRFFEEPDPMVEARQGKWKIWLSTFSVQSASQHNSRFTYTQVRCPILKAQNEFTFSIKRVGLFGRLLDMPDLKTGIPEFDKEFIIKGSDSETIRAWISNPNIRFLIESQIKIMGKFEIPDTSATQVDLFFEEEGVIEDIFFIAQN